MEYDDRKNEILNTAKKFFYSAGYEKTSVNMIIEELGIAKGTFYHYFNSKVELLDELVDKIAIQIMTAAEPVLESDLDAVDKLNKIFETARIIKEDNIELMIPAMKVLYSDDNIITRYKMNKKNSERLLPLYTKIIEQGISEGLFDTDYPEQAALAIIYLWFGYGEKLVNDLLSNQNLNLLMRSFDALKDSIKRILGIKERIFTFVDIKALKKYVDILKKN